MSYKEAYDELYSMLKAMHEKNEARNMANMLFEDIYNWKPIKEDREFNQLELDRFRIYMDRLKSGEPIQYITGLTNFYGYFLNVTPPVSMIRVLLSQALELIQHELHSKNIRKN